MAHNRATRLEDDRQADAAQFGNNGARVVGGPDNRTPFIRNAKPAAQIDMFEREPVVAQLQRKRHERLRGAAQRLERGDLRPDVDVHADKPQPRDVAALAIDGARLLQRHAELVGLQAGRDVGMALRVDVRIDAQRDARDAPLRARDRGNPIELAGRLGVDRADACARSRTRARRASSRRR